MVTPSKIFPMVLIAALALAGRADAEAGFLKNYKTGLAAIEAENWPRAAELMRQAIRERATASRRLPKHLYLKPYLPHFYLGLAHFKQGDCKGALEAWKISESQGIVRKRPQYEQIVLARELCRDRPSSQAAVARRPSVPPRTEPRPRLFEPPSPPPSRSPSAPARTTGARTRPSPVNKKPGTTEPFPIQQPSRPSPLTFNDTPQRIEIPATPPDELLLAAAAALFNGSYQQVVDQLSQQPLEDPYARTHAHLLLAAAEFALYLEALEQDGGRLESARKHVLDVRRSLPDLEPPPRFFSPRFLDFFYGQRPDEVRR